VAFELSGLELAVAKKNLKVLARDLEIASLKRSLAVAERLRFEAQKSRLKPSLSFDPRLFVSGVAHEFNNILGAIEGHVEWALESDDPKVWKEALEITKKGTARSHHVTRTLQGMFQPQEEQWQLESFCTSVLDALELLRGRTDQAHVTVQTKVKTNKSSDGSDVVYVRQGLIGDVVTNLIHNAVDALLQVPVEKRRLVLELRRLTKFWCLSVQDTGPGVPEAFSDQLFRPFFTTKGVMAHYQNQEQSPDRGQTQGGSGLGLFWSRTLVEQAGGTLTLKVSDKVGACFLLCLPRVSAQRHAGGAKPTRFNPGRRRAKVPRQKR
jgi:signal transduction histidine kinase